MLKSGVHRQFYATVCGNLMTFCFGLAVGWPSSTLIQLQSQETPLKSGPLTIDEASWTSSIMCLGGAVSTIFYGWISEKLGRKPSLLCLFFPTLVSWLFIEFSENVYHLYIARFLAGFGGGGSFIVVPVYVTEIASDHVRGLFGSLTVLSHNFGIVAAYIACSYLNYFTVPYFGVVFSIIFFVWCFTIPESPKYLLERNELERAAIAWEYFNEGKFSAKDHEKNISSGESLTKRDLCEPAARRGIILGFILITLTCSSGAFVLLHYTESIFEEAGSTLSPKVSSIIVASIQLSGSYVATFMVERAGRKLLIIASSCSAATCLSIMGIYTFLQSAAGTGEQHYWLLQFSWLPLACLSGVVFLAANGSASLPYVVLCEILGQRIRAFVSTLCLVEDWVLAFAYVKFLPFMIEHWGMSGALWFFAAVNYSLSLLLFFLLPETKGKSIEQITNKLANR